MYLIIILSIKCVIFLLSLLIESFLKNVIFLNQFFFNIAFLIYIKFIILFN